MYSVSEIDLPADVGAVLDGYVAAAAASQGGLWRRVVSSLTPWSSGFVAERAAAAQRILAGGRCTEVRLRHDDPPAVMTHEHGLLVLAPIEAGRTLMLDVSSIADDPRWELHEAGALMRSTWRWLRLEGLAAHGFMASGAPIVPIDLGDLHGSALESVLSEEMGWPGDDAVLDLPLARIMALARERA